MRCANVTLKCFTGLLKRIIKKQTWILLSYYNRHYHIKCHDCTQFVQDCSWFLTLLSVISS